MNHWDQEPKSPHTFIVTADLAQPEMFNRLHRQVNEWEKIAHKTIVGPWCERYEATWENVPVYTHTLPNNSIVKYGYCRTQSQKQPDRELWFVAFRNANPSDTPSTFVVDKMCVEIPFLNRMGNDHKKWSMICWCRLDEGNEVSWEQLKTGTMDGGYVRSNTFALDSPFLPLSVEDIPIRIQMFEDQIAEQFEQYEKQNQGILKRKHRWENLSTVDKEKLEQFWRKKAYQKILNSIRTP